MPESKERIFLNTLREELQKLPPDERVSITAEDFSMRVAGLLDPGSKTYLETMANTYKGKSVESMLKGLERIIARRERRSGGESMRPGDTTLQ